MTKKSSKQQLNNEVMKNRDLLKQLEAAKDTIKELQNVIKVTYANSQGKHATSLLYS